MANPLRLEVPGALYHVSNRRNRRNQNLDEDHDRSVVLKIGHTVDRFDLEQGCRMKQIANFRDLHAAAANRAVRQAEAEAEVSCCKN